MAASWLNDAQKAALKATADAMSAPGKGFLASDESAGPWLRAGHVDAKKIPDTAENRAAYRSMLYKTPGLSTYISGVILHWETLFQSDADGKKMVDLITGNGMIPGIKLDKGYDKSGIPGTAVGPLGHPETWDKGIDDLDKRCAEAYAQGARFAKWRNVLQIDPANGLPSELAITLSSHNLAQYATICQRNGLVPIVEPEIVPNGKHGIEACADATEKVLVAQFAALKLHGVYLEGAVLKPNMVKNGLEGPRATAEEIATLTVTVLKRTVPSAIPGTPPESTRACPSAPERARACPSVPVPGTPPRHLHLPDAAAALQGASQTLPPALLADRAIRPPHLLRALAPPRPSAHPLEKIEHAGNPPLSLPLSLPQASSSSPVRRRSTRTTRRRQPSTSTR